MRKVSFTIDGTGADAPAGVSLLEFARGEGIDIPTLCHLDGYAPSGSCLVCLVRDGVTDRLVPACATQPRDGAVFVTSSPPVLAARRRSLELLLGEHVGECEAPCVRACPGGVDIPRMMRQIAAGKTGEALTTIQNRLALPASLSWICAVSCERACRRSRHDGPVSICLLKRHAALRGLDSASTVKPPARTAGGARVAVVGGGPAGLSTAWFLRREGHVCTVFEKEPKVGGQLRNSQGEIPPPEVLEAEVDNLRRLGAVLETGKALGRDIGLDDLLGDFDAVVLATGAAEKGRIPNLGRDFGVEVTEWGIAVEPHTLRTSLDRVYAAGEAVRPRRHPAVGAAQGRSAALAVHILLSGGAGDTGDRRFSSVLGSLLEGEMAEFLKGSNPSPPVKPSSGEMYSTEEARREAARCMHCDCRKKEACRLRDAGEAMAAVQRRYAGRERELVRRVREHSAIVFEPGKCIRCGLCLQAASGAAGRPGLAFLGKGIDMRVGTPFGITLAKAIGPAAAECATVCPTGAISRAD